jgi:hypothetical protein
LYLYWQSESVRSGDHTDVTLALGSLDIFRYIPKCIFARNFIYFTVIVKVSNEEVLGVL